DVLGELRGVSVAQNRVAGNNCGTEQGERVEHVLRGLLPQARGEHSQVVAAENRYQLGDVHHGHLLGRDERRGLLCRDGARWDGVGIVHSMFYILVSPPVQRKNDSMMQRDVVDGGNDGARCVKRRHGVRVGESQSTIDGTHCLGSLRLARGALSLPFVFV
ncbi:hypothetical protein B0H13DRAFT_1951009, partial [Mycena leptocephala]